MPGLMEVFILKERVNDNRDDSIFMMLFEKAFILISLLVGPIVYGHYYFIYIRPAKKQQNIDLKKKEGRNKRK